MIADFIRTFGTLLFVVLLTIAALLLIIAIKLLLIRANRSKLEQMANNIAEMSKERSDLKVFAYSVKCENDVHAETIKRQARELDAKDQEIKTLKETIETLSAGMPVGPEGFRFARVNPQ